MGLNTQTGECCYQPSLMCSCCWGRWSGGRLYQPWGNSSIKFKAYIANRRVLGNLSVRDCARKNTVREWEENFNAPKAIQVAEEQGVLASVARFITSLILVELFSQMLWNSLRRICNRKSYCPCLTDEPSRNIKAWWELFLGGKNSPSTNKRRIPNQSCRGGRA